MGKSPLAKTKNAFDKPTSKNKKKRKPKPDSLIYSDRPEAMPVENRAMKAFDSITSLDRGKVKPVVNY